MTGGSPLVTVAMPTFNGGAHIADALNSVLGQTLVEVEVIVIDDASDDDTVAVASTFSDPRLRVIRNDQRLGPEGNWNRALAEGRSPLVKIMAQDDLIYPECLERQVAALKANPDAVFAAVRRDIVDAEGRRLVSDRGLAGMDGVVDGSEALRRATRAGTNVFGEGAAVLLRREAALAAGGFREARPYVIDLDLWVRLLRRRPFIAVNETLAAFRVSEGSWSASLARRQAGQVRDLLRELATDPATEVTRLDYAMGWLRAGVTARLRRLAYAIVARRSARGDTSAPSIAE